MLLAAPSALPSEYLWTSFHPRTEPLTLTLTLPPWLSSEMATAVRILAVVRDGNWSEFFRLLGNFTPKSKDDAIREGKTLLVGGENASSPFAVRLRCVCHGMLLPVRAHALRAMNKAYGKSEKVPLVSGDFFPLFVRFSSLSSRSSKSDKDCFPPP